MNNATEQMLGAKLNAQQSHFASMAALRNVWLTSPGDIIVSVRPLGKDFENYVYRTLGFMPGSFTVIHPEQSGSARLTDELLLSNTLIDTLRERMRERGPWSMLACYQTEGTARLQSVLGLPDSVGRRFAEARGTDLLNRKSHFRQFACAAGLPLAPGTIVTSVDALSDALQKFVLPTGMVIVKRDNGAGGTGNIVVTCTDAAPRAGAFETMSAGSDISSLASPLWRKMVGDREGVLVVESYHSAERMFYLEFCIADDGTIEFLNSGAIRTRPHDDPHAKHLFWIGLELPADVKPASYASAVSLATGFTKLAAQIGYRGHINIDAIVTDRGDLLFNEANGRWGGGTVLHSVARILLGPQFGETHVISSFRDVAAPDLPTTLAALEDRGLHFDPRRNEGVVVLACDDVFTHTIEALVIGHTRDRLRYLEAQLLDAMRSVAGVAA